MWNSSVGGPYGSETVNLCFAPDEVSLKMEPLHYKVSFLRKHSYLIGAFLWEYSKKKGVFGFCAGIKTPQIHYFKNLVDEIYK
jgi:hypothetical protein